MEYRILTGKKDEISTVSLGIALTDPSAAAAVSVQ